MSEKYTYADVIIDPEDPRVEIGKEYYSSKNIPDALFKANEGDEMFCYKLLSVHDGAYGPFWMDKDSPSSFDFLIRKKEPVKKYVPFDLSNEEARKSLKGRWIKSTDGEYQISGFHSYDGEDGTEWEVAIAYKYISPEVLLALWTFDDGTPCGKLVEVEEE